MGLSKEDIGNNKGSDSTNEIAEKATTHRVTGVLNAYTTEIHRNNIESRICRTLQHTAQTTN